MRKKKWFLLTLAMFLFFPNWVFADCLDLGDFSSWVLEDSHTVVFYRGLRPVAILTIPDCQIHPASSIRLIKGYVCDLDDIIIDGERCGIMTVNATY